VVREVWIAPFSHPSIAVVVRVVVVYWVLGTIFETEVNLGHLVRRFVTGKDARKEERAYDGDPRRVDEDFVVAASAGDLKQC